MSSAEESTNTVPTTTATTVEVNEVKTEISASVSNPFAGLTAAAPVASSNANVKEDAEGEDNEVRKRLGLGLGQFQLNYRNFLGRRS